MKWSVLKCIPWNVYLTTHVTFNKGESCIRAVLVCMNATRLYIQVVKENAVEHNTENTTVLPAGIIICGYQYMKLSIQGTTHCICIMCNIRTTVAVSLWQCEHGK